MIRLCFLALWLSSILNLAGDAAQAKPAPVAARPALSTISDTVRLAQAQPAPLPIPGVTAPSPPPLTAPGTAAAPIPASTVGAEPIGNVATLTGSATVTRHNTSTPLQLKDDIFENDVLQTAANSKLGVTFNDATTFNLTANSRITVDSFVYQDGGAQNGALFDVAKGTVAFVAAAVAKTGDMRISTPTATLGIRGTTGLIDVPDGASAASASNVAIKLYPDPDGRVGQIEIKGRDGARLGLLTQGASGFAIRPGAGGRVTAAPLVISLQQAERDRGLVRQLHAAQNVGRQIITERRAQRRQNPATNPGTANPPRPPGQPKQNGAPKQPGQPKLNDLPKLGGQPKQNGLPKTPTPSNRALQPAQPAPAPGLQRSPNQPALRQPALPNQPAPTKPRPVRPKPRGKPNPERP